jgi:biotin carboxyl carrier protein
MKMANSITTPAAGKVKEIKFASGDKVARDDVLAVIG